MRNSRRFKNEAGVAFVTFTVDPARDDLKALNDYSAPRNADPERWLFLTGDEAMIHALMREQFKQPVERKSGPDVSPATSSGIARGSSLWTEEVIRGMYAGLPDEHFADHFADDRARLRNRIRELLGER